MSFVPEDLFQKTKFTCFTFGRIWLDPLDTFHTLRVSMSWFPVKVGFIVQGQHPRGLESSRNLRGGRFQAPAPTPDRRRLDENGRIKWTLWFVLAFTFMSWQVLPV